MTVVYQLLIYFGDNWVTMCSIRDTKILEHTVYAS